MYYNISDRDIRIIKALEQKTIKNGATKFEEQNAKEKIECIKSKYKKEEKYKVNYYYTAYKNKIIYKCPVCGKSYYPKSKFLFIIINFDFYNITMCKECNTLFNILYEDTEIIKYTQVTLPIYKIFINLYDLYTKDKLHFKLAYLNSKLIDKLKFIIYYIFRKMTNILPR